LRSAVETLPSAKTVEAHQRLNAIIQHDIRRLDRLISDISDASRLDAELARSDMDVVDLSRLLEAVVTVANEVKHEELVRITLDIAPKPRDDDPRHRNFKVLGFDSRLGQVFNNLIDNARSFSTPRGNVRVCLRQTKAEARSGMLRDGFEIIVDDDGPGIPDDAFERIFERFYTDRPNQGFGQNSGLGLSISRQIIEAHGGRVTAVNRLAPSSMSGDGRAPVVLGARFTVWLPAAPK
jgi:two-component system sensor histidine kinase ChvG